MNFTTLKLSKLWTELTKIGHIFRKYSILKFIYSEKATKFWEIFPLLLTTVHTVKSKGKISQNFVAFSEYMNFNNMNFILFFLHAKTLKKWQFCSFSGDMLVIEHDKTMLLHFNYILPCYLKRIIYLWNSWLSNYFWGDFPQFSLHYLLKY